MATTTKKSKTYQWAVVNSDGRLMRESNDRRAIYKTRDAARLAARSLDGKVVRREEITVSV